MPCKLYFNASVFFSVSKIILREPYLHVYRALVSHCCFLGPACGSYSHCTATALVQCLDRWNFAFSRVPPAETIRHLPHFHRVQNPGTPNYSNQTNLCTAITRFLPASNSDSIPSSILRNNQGPRFNRKIRVIHLATQVSVPGQTCRSAATAPNAL